MSSSPVQPMIEIRGVTKRFGTFTAVNDVSLTVQPGEFITLLGPSGCGKTSMLRMLSGFEQPDAGSIASAGEEVTHLAPYRRNVNQVFQSYALFPHLSVRDNIAFGLTDWRRRLKPADAARVDELIEAFGLTAMARSRPATLSGGQQQRVALARALASNPQVLLLDEPFTALHPLLRRQLRDELRAVRERWGIPALMITHDLDDVAALAQRAYVVDGGRITRTVDLTAGQGHAALDDLPAPSADEQRRLALLKAELA